MEQLIHPATATDAATALAIEAASEAHAGRLAAASALLTQLTSLLATQGTAGAACVAYQVEALGALGQVEAACAVGEAALATLDGPSPGQGLLEATLATPLGLAGRHEDGLHSAERALTTAQKSGSQAVALRAAIARAEIALRANDCEAAAHAAGEGLAGAADCKLSAARLHGLLGEAVLGRGEKGARDHFEAMKTLAEAIGAKALQAQALFGLAASGPHSEAYPQVTEAQRLVRELVDGLDAEAAERVLALPALARILAGNHVAFGRPRVRRSPTGPVGFPPRMMGW